MFIHLFIHVCKILIPPPPTTIMRLTLSCQLTWVTENSVLWNIWSLLT